MKTETEKQDYRIDGSYFAIIPNNILYSKELNGNDIRLYAIISSLANTKGYCFASNSRLGDNIGMSNSTVSKSISKMTQIGFVSIELIYNPGTKEVKERRIYINKVEGSSQVKGGSSQVKGGSSQVKGGSSPVTSIKEQSKRTSIKRELPTSNLSPKEDINALEPKTQESESLVTSKKPEYDMLFNTLVSNYPESLVKHAKLKWARKAFDNLDLNQATQAIDNLVTYLKLWDGFNHNLENYITGLYFTPEVLNTRKKSNIKATGQPDNKTFSGKYY